MRTCEPIDEVSAPESAAATSANFAVPERQAMGRHLAWLLLLLPLLLQHFGDSDGTQTLEQTPLQFTHFQYNVTVHENSAAKTYVGHPVKMGIYISNPLWELRYKIVSGDNENLFKAEEYILGDFCFLRIRTKGGNTAILNREVKDHYTLIVKAVEKNTNAEARTKVRVQVLDTNDLRPLFSPTSYSVSLLENTAIRTSIARVSATDADIGTNGEFYYSFKDRTDMFAIHPTSGTVVLTGRLDYAEAKLYEMEILAVDRGMKLYGSSGVSSMAKLTVHVEQANECAPVITAVTLSPSELDKDPTYAVVTVDDCDQGVNGEIASLSIVAEPIKRQQAAHFELEVTTSDKRASTRVLVKVLSANSNPPEFTQTTYKASFNENVPIGTTVLSVSAVDPDEGENGYVTYSIANLNHVPFVINHFTGAVSTSENLDYELMPRVYTLRIRASDWGLPYRREVEVLATLTLNNLNDNTPLFEKINCEGTIPRDLGVGEQITTVSAIDADELQLVRYQIEAGNELDLFSLNPNSGVLSLKQSLSDVLDAKVSFHSLRITATDGENFATPLYINITVAASRKPVNLQCEETGVAKMLAEKLLQANKLHRQAEVEDIFFDSHSVNAHTPQFRNTLSTGIEINENHPVGSSIILINATDLDTGFNGKLVYAISGGNEDSCFIIDMETGMLKVLSPLDRETRDEYTLNITVSDLGIPQKAAWRLLDVTVLDANDNPPEFLQESYFVEVNEDKEENSEIIQVEATDKDLGPNGHVTYSILTDTDKFSIDSMTGVVRVVNSLDREAQHIHYLKIEARDQATEEPQLLSTVLLKISLEDVNDNPPRFIPPNYRVKVREDLPEGAIIMWLEAYDPDLGQSSQVRYSLMDHGEGNFDVDKLSGAVRILQQLDFEKKQVYNLTVRAKDKGKPVSLSSTCYVEVEVIDVNENLHPPVFSSFVEKGVVKEDVPIGSSVMTVCAHDEDTGRDGEIRYSIRDGSGVGVFKIDEETATGLAFLKHAFHSIMHAAETCTVGETSVRGWSSIIGTERFNTAVLSRSPIANLDPSPGFTPGFLGTSVTGAVSSCSRPCGPPFLASGRRLSVALSACFRRVIETSDQLDRESTSHYWLTVYATDQGVVPLASFIEIYIGVEDVNDNAPQTSEPVYYPEVMENSPKDVSVVQIEAFDPDSSSNDRLTYKVTSGNPQGFFSIHPKT
ncbi:hypothetical protein MC885_013008, partial [Smutsia gigantea]